MASSNSRNLCFSDLLSSYPILSTLSAWISTVDLFNLSLTNRTHFSYIQSSRLLWRTLSRHCLCDGRGLIRRQEYRYPYGEVSRMAYYREEEPLEVRLFNVKCDVGGALPCIKCGINVCEECRYYPRVPLDRGYPERRPHVNSWMGLENIMALCPPCDEAAERSVKGKFLNELCDCDVFTRWICLHCKTIENNFSSDYFEEYTKLDHEWVDENGEYTIQSPPTKVMGDHQSSRALWCICGQSVPEATVPRCTWCKRHHLPEDQWMQEYDEIGCKMPWFDDDPDYPHWPDQYLEELNGPFQYPELGYRRTNEDE